MRAFRPTRAAALIWLGVAGVTVTPIALAALSPFLAYRNLDYIVGGFAGILCLSLLVVQPLAAAGYLPGLKGLAGRRCHRAIGALIALCVFLHIGGLYLTSAPDTLDALLLVSPTPFSVYGVTAMWAVVFTVFLALFRRRLGLRYSVWRLIHNGLALVVVVATIVHAVQIQGAMEPVSKWLLCGAALFATGFVIVNLRVIKPMLRWRDQRRRSEEM